MALTLQAIPLSKRGPFNNITDWNTFKTKLIEEFGSIDIFGRDVNQVFNLLPRYESVQEVAEDLSHKIKTLQANLEIMQDFHDKEDLHSVALTQTLVQNIMKSLPLEVRPSFNDQFSKFRDQCPANVRPPATFFFLATFVEKLEKNYRSTPYLYDLDLNPSSVGINVVRQEASKPKPQPPRPADPPRNFPPKPCAMCSIMGFENNHFSLTRNCGVGKLGSPEILKLIAENNLCFLCTLAHGKSFKCKPTYFNGISKACPKGCMERGTPVHRRACMHSNQAPFVSVSKVSADKSVPLVETMLLGNSPIGIQYDTGCQLSLISKSALSTIPRSMYSLGNSSQVKIMTYAGEGKIVLTTTVKLRIQGKTLKLSTIEENLNNGSAFSFSIPTKWRSFTKSSTSNHDGQVSILLGGDNLLSFPTEIERDSLGMALYRSTLTNNYMVYGAVPSKLITWSEAPLAHTVNTVIINALSVQDVQDQLLLLTSAEDFTTPSNREQLLQITKEKNIQAIMDNTFVDTVKGRVQVNCLYKPNLPNLGENYYGATKRIYALHARTADKPEITAKIDKYINQQINNRNYIEINPDDHRDQHQLHFVAYNFVVSSTSSSTKARVE